VAEGVLVDHQAHDEVEQIADVILVLRRPAQEREAETRLLDEGLNALTDDRPPVSVEPATRNRIRRTLPIGDLLAAMGVLRKPTPPPWWHANRHRIFGIGGVLLGYGLPQSLPLSPEPASTTQRTGRTGVKHDRTGCISSRRSDG
jgi:hypothetical protein